MLWPVSELQSDKCIGSHSAFEAQKWKENVKNHWTLNTKITNSFDAEYKPSHANFSYKQQSIKYAWLRWNKILTRTFLKKKLYWSTKAVMCNSSIVAEVSGFW